MSPPLGGFLCRSGIRWKGNEAKEEAFSFILYLDRISGFESWGTKVHPVEIPSPFRKDNSSFSFMLPSLPNKTRTSRPALDSTNVNVNQGASPPRQHRPTVRPQKSAESTACQSPIACANTGSVGIVSRARAGACCSICLLPIANLPKQRWRPLCLSIDSRRKIESSALTIASSLPLISYSAPPRPSPCSRMDGKLRQNELTSFMFSRAAEPDSGLDARACLRLQFDKSNDTEVEVEIEIERRFGFKSWLV